MQSSKIRLSPSEAALFCNAEVILTKNSILQKTVALLTQVQEQIVAESSVLRAISSPKISKGENYLGLPYVVLDYPRIANGGNLFFVRSMFWWGHFFSSTLQVAGTYKEEHLFKLAGAYDSLQTYFVGINADPWQHHFEALNYKKIAALSKDEFDFLLQQQPHIKIAASWPLSEWDVAANLLVNSWQFLTGLVA